MTKQRPSFIKEVIQGGPTAVEAVPSTRPGRQGYVERVIEGAQINGQSASGTPEAMRLVEYVRADTGKTASEERKSFAAAHAQKSLNQSAGEAARLKAKPLNWSELPTSSKVNIGLSGAAALMAGFGAIQAAQGAVGVNADGQKQVSWNQVGIALIQGTFSLGCGYLALSSLRGR